MEHIVSVAVIGAGLAGISAAVTLKRKFKDRIDLVVYEKAPNIGGTWRENIYPGCAADSAIHLYSLSNCPNPSWSRTQATQPEILAYLASIVHENDLAPHIHLNRKLTSAKWDPSSYKYVAELEDITTGSTFTSTHHILISAAGILPRPRMPDVPGIDGFEGRLLHSSQWDPDIDLRNKRVAVIGNGTSAAQLIPEIAKFEGVQITQIFRRANWLLPYRSRAISPQMQERFRKYPITLRIFRCALFFLHELLYLFIFGSGLLRSLSMKICKKYILKNSPQKYNDILIPDYPMGCRRVVFNVSYLHSLHRQNVKLINRPVKRLTETGLITADGQYHDFDVIIATTGFDTHVAPLNVQGINSSTLQKYFDRLGGPEAYLGTMVPGFPNLFVLGGPNTLTGYMSYCFSVECQLNYIMPIVTRLGSTQFSSFEVTQKASDRYNRTLKRRFKDSIWDTLSARHYTDPSSGKHIFLFPGCTILFWWWTRSPKWRDFLIDGKEFKPVKVSRSMLSICTALFLIIILVLVLVTLDKDRRGIR